MGVRIAINGFGRIGKSFLRTVMQDKKAKENIKVVAINLGPTSIENIATFFKYDSVMGTFKGEVKLKDQVLKIDNHEMQILSESDPSKLAWDKLNIEWVVEASGKFTTKEKANMHISSGAKKVLITAPATDEDITIIPGVNDDSYDKEKHKLISLGSCTTNCIAPIVKVIKESFDLVEGLMTTTHAYTNNQALLDNKQKDPRRGRAAALNIVPTTTGADKVITKIYPELKGKIKGIAIRVPVPTVSLVDFTFTTNKPISSKDINQAFENYANNKLKNILSYSTEPLVSSDFICSPYSCIIDSLMTTANNKIGKVFGWYDNEFGYSSRLKDFLLHNL